MRNVHFAQDQRRRSSAKRVLLVVSALLLLFTPGTSSVAQSKHLSKSSTQFGKITDYTLPAAKLQQAHALYETDIWLSIATTIYSFLVLFALLRFRVVVRFRELAERSSHWRIVQAAIVLTLFLITFAALMLLPNIYGHHVSRAYGLSVQGWASWFRDWAVQLALVSLVGSVTTWIFYAMVRRSPTRWWFHFWLIIIPISAFLTFVSPAVIEPLFNRYKPLQEADPGLVSALEKVVHRTGIEIPPDRMFEMVASAKVTGPNAYVTGFGATKRVVVWDTAIDEFTTPQLMYVFSHELGHYVLNHILKGFTFGLIVFFGLFYLSFRVSRWVEHRWGTQWGLRGLDDFASIPLVVLVLLVLVFLSSPVLNAYSRHLEHQADQFGLELTHGLIPDSSQVAAQSFQILGEQWLDYPYPNRLAVFWDWTHPPTRDRIHFALTYDPWHEGRSPEFIK